MKKTPALTIVDGDNDGLAKFLANPPRDTPRFVIAAVRRAKRLEEKLDVLDAIETAKSRGKHGRA